MKKHIMILLALGLAAAPLGEAAWEAGKKRLKPLPADTKGQGGPSDIRTQLGRLVQLPASGKQRLRLQLGSEGATGWTVEVRANGERLARIFIP